MKAILSLEYIGLNVVDQLKGYERLLLEMGVHNLEIGANKIRRGPWVAEIFRDESGDIRPAWLCGKRDYSKSNSKGSRGVYVHYILEEDRLYWVQAPQSWKSTTRYFAAVTSTGDIKKLTEEEVEEWRSAL